MCVCVCAGDPGVCVCGQVIQARQTGTTAKEEKQGRREAAHGVKERRGSGLSRVHVQPTDLDLDDVLKNETVKVKLPMQ